MQIRGWAMRATGQPLEQIGVECPALHDDQVLIEVAACGVCHTDLGYLFSGVPLRGSVPLILGHEIAGLVVDAGPVARGWLGKRVVVPAVTPCGSCDPCLRGRTAICRDQTFVGNDVHGGFASHVVITARGLAEIPESIDLEESAVIADAVTTPFNAVERSGLAAGDVAIFVGVGGIGCFGVQIAKARGAHVVALDVDQRRLDGCASHGADLTINCQGSAAQTLKKELRGEAKQRGWPAAEWKIFETSGTVAGQATAFGLLGFGATLMVVGYANREVSVRLANLMAFDASAHGVWGCPPALYPKAVELVATGKVLIAPFVEKHPLHEIRELLDALHRGAIRRRVILTMNQGAC